MLCKAADPATARAAGGRADRTTSGDENTAMRFVVGLGNPTRQYEPTRHNVGFRVIDALRARWHAGAGRRAFRGRCYDARPRSGSAEARVLLLKPHTYMNASGEAVGEMAAFYKADCRDVLIVLDDLALPRGKLRARAGGSPGGHKGLADVQRVLGSDRVPRLRIGIGAPPAGMDSVDYVLGRFGAAEWAEVGPAVERAAQAVEDWVFHDLTYVMDRYNQSSQA